MLQAQVELLQGCEGGLPVIPAAHAGGGRLHQLHCQLAELVMRNPVLHHDLPPHKQMMQRVTWDCTYPEDSHMHNECIMQRGQPHMHDTLIHGY